MRVLVDRFALLHDGTWQAWVDTRRPRPVEDALTAALFNREPVTVLVKQADDWGMGIGTPESVGQYGLRIVGSEFRVARWYERIFLSWLYRAFERIEKRGSERVS